MNWSLRLLAFLREALSEDGQGSWSHVGSAVVACPERSRRVAALVYVIIATRSIPERTEELAWVLAALYGVNQLKAFGRWLAQVRSSKHGARQNQLTRG